MRAATVAQSTALVWTQPSVAPGIAFTTNLTPAAFEESTSSQVTGTSNLVVQSYQERSVGAEEIPFGHATGGTRPAPMIPSLLHQRLRATHGGRRHHPSTVLNNTPPRTFDPGSFPPSSMSPIDHFDWPYPAVDGYTSPSPPFDGFDDSSFAPESLRTSASALPSSSIGLEDIDKDEWVLQACEFEVWQGLKTDTKSTGNGAWSAAAPSNIGIALLGSRPKWHLAKVSESRREA
ncbi:hypothetical protein C8R46DRAFT_1194166 [Mycena filopes]|nr:hypothetical protein C8R46DRAFT_1194166 [Mycena filopes]